MILGKFLLKEKGLKREENTKGDYCILNWIVLKKKLWRNVIEWGIHHSLTHTSSCLLSTSYSVLYTLHKGNW